jgi:hypothetical protein
MSSVMVRLEMAWRVGAALAFTVAEARLFVGAGSRDADEALATFVWKPDPTACATSVTLAPALTPSVANAHDTRPALCEQLPTLGVADTNASPGGNTFVSTVEPAASGPRFVTVSV